MSVVECFFDFSSPFAYLGTTQIERVAAEAGGEVRFRPFLLGALFKALGTPLVPLHTFPESKRRHQELDLARWADFYGVPFRFTSHFPLRTVTALRLALVVDEPRFVHRVMRAAWVEDRDVGQNDVLSACLSDLGLDPALVERTEEPEVKARLREATDEALARGVPGAPTFIVEDRVYWGQDRLPFVDRALRGRPVGPA
ncbi:MAG: 2-hydroxychromene-2-carboxylate isomerase [Sandaracinaceae bacterium]